MTTNPRDCDEHYDRRAKGADEIFCTSCGAIIKAEAEVCPKCGVRNKSKVVAEGGPSGKPKGSMVVLVLLIIFFWPAAIIYYYSKSWPKN